MTKHSRSKTPNPQGKGQLPILATLSESRIAAHAAPAKGVGQITSELFTSLLVLGSDFKFKPVVGKPYFLYFKEERFRLSPLSPNDWGDERISGRFVGECALQADLTWTLALSETLSPDEYLVSLLKEKQQRFQRQLEQAERLEDILPTYQAKDDFYQRAFAFALSHSLGASMQKSGIQALDYEQARQLLLETRSKGSSAQD